MTKPSELPQDIIQRILSFLPTKEAVQTSLLSKTWLFASSHLPNLDFSRSHFLSQENFTQFVNTTLHRHNLTIHTFSLSVHLSDTNTSSCINKWLKIAVGKGVKHLSISLTSDENSVTYTVPEVIFASDSLISLEVRNHDHVNEFLRHSVCFSLANRDVLSQLKRCHTLKRLHLRGVRVENSTIAWLSAVFPSIEELSIDDCFMMYEVNFSGFLNLKTLYVRSFPVSIHMISVKSLESLTITGLRSYGCGGLHYISTISPYQNLKHLRFEKLSVNHKNFHALLSNCPSLENLVIKNSYSFEDINISSRTLKRMILWYVSGLKEVKIDAPNLVAFEHVCGTLPTFSLTRFSTNFKPCLHVIYIDTTLMIKLRGFLTQLNLSQVCLKIDCLRNCFRFEELLMVPRILYSRPRIKNLELDICNPYVSYSTLLDGLFWSFFPKTVTVFYTSNENLELIKYLCQEVMKRRGFSCFCFNPNHIMCWRHYLWYCDVEFRDQESEDLQMVWYELDPKKLVDGSVSLRGGSQVRFTMTWGSF